MKAAAKDKAQGMVDYMFGKKKDKDGQPAEDLPIGEQIEENPFEMEFMKDFIDVVPAKVQFEDIPKIRDAKQDWSLGMRKIEQQFAEHVAMMHLDFEHKADKYQEVQEQLETNLAFFEQFYITMQ
jgi:hypothetical protein